MQKIILYRSDFKVIEGISCFEIILGDLEIPPKERDSIIYIEIKVDDFKTN